MFVPMNDSGKYESWRSRADGWLNVICRDGCFERLPEEIRHRGPWMGGRRGPISQLKSWNRHVLDMEGYVVIPCHQMDFEPETR